jgi:hypothetical protein
VAVCGHTRTGPGKKGLADGAGFSNDATHAVAPASGPKVAPVYPAQSFFYLHGLSGAPDPCHGCGFVLVDDQSEVRQDPLKPVTSSGGAGL